MAEFYLIDQDTQAPGGPVIKNYPEDIDILDFISGRKLLRDKDEEIVMTLAASSGSFRPDLITYLLPIFSDRMKVILTELGVDNIDYYPVVFKSLANDESEKGYWLSNILGSVECVDISQSDATQHPLSKKYTFKSFVVDETRAGSFKVFRLAEMRQMIVMSESLKNQLTQRHLDGVRIINTRDYEGD